jgi:hypothetical protein
MIVYLITNKINGKRYVGQTIQTLDQRWSKHCSVSSANCGMPIVLAIQKYGQENFERKILSVCDNIDQMNHRESYYIRLLNTRTPNGYNVLSGGKNSLHTEETKKKISIAQTGEKNHNFGKNASIETKEKMSKSQTGKHRWSEDERKAISQRVSGEKHGMFGKHHTQEAIDKISKAQKGLNTWTLGTKVKNETKKKISEAQMGRITSQETKQKLSVANSKPEMEIFCHQNNTLYPSISNASKNLGLIRQKIREVLQGKAQHTKGYTFEYTNKENCKKRKFKTKKLILCHQTGVIYPSIVEAGKILGICHPNIHSSLKTGKKVKGYSFELIKEENK